MKRLLLILLLISTNCFADHEIGFECIHRDFGCDMWRSPFPGGWLIRSKVGYGESMVFFPDPNHEWKV